MALPRMRNAFADTMQTQGLSAICGIGLGADSEEKHEPASDIDTVVVDGLKALDPKRPIREADIRLAERGLIGRPYKPSTTAAPHGRPAAAPGIGHLSRQSYI